MLYSLKYKNGNLMKSNQILTGIFCLLFTNQTWALHNTPGEHWFEIEVILFSQIGDKTVLKEQFNEASELPAYSRYIDLLKNYTKPDIKALKQLLPYCDSPTYPLNVDYASFNEAQLKAAFNLTANIPLKALAEIEQTRSVTFQTTASPNATGELNDNKALSDVLSDVAKDEEDDFYRESALNNGNRDALSEANNINERTLNSEQVALVAAANTYFKAKQAKQTQHVSLPALSANNLCAWSPQYYQRLKAGNNALPAYNDIQISDISVDIDGAEHLFSNSPYLISQQSLQLSDIKKQLSLSKNFKPLLHFGWRQHTVDKNEAIPLKVFAGDNLVLNHKQELQKREDDKARLAAQEAELSQALSDKAIEDDTQSLFNRTFFSDEPLKSHNQNADDDAEREALISERIEDIIEQIGQSPSDIETLIKQEEIPLEQTNELLVDAPQAPVQPWYLDGFIKVHVRHYLHITADFNIMDKTLAEQKKLLAANTELDGILHKKEIDIKAINFKQDRRVISGQIHYFDHPYMGMVLQVRRYKKPERQHDENTEHEH